MDSELKKEKIKEDIYNYLKQGMFKKDASRMSGISEDTYLRWYKEDEGFADRVEASILEYKHSLIQTLNTQATKNGMLALQILKTRWFKEWGIPQTAEQNDGDKNSIKRIEDIVDELLVEPDEESINQSEQFS